MTRSLDSLTVARDYLRRGVRATIAGTSRALLPAEWRRRLAVKAPWLPVAVVAERQAGPVKDAAFFERHFAASEDDPYGFATNEWELVKYERTLAVCDPRPGASVLELACASGVFTRMLAPRCGALLAVDISEIAVERARARVAEFAHVRCERCTLPDQMPPGRFDLIVCSDVLTYFTEDDIRASARAMAARTAPGGAIVVVNHWRRITTEPERMFELLREELVDFHESRSEQLERHRIVRFDRSRSAGQAMSGAGA